MNKYLFISTYEQHDAACKFGAWFYANGITAWVVSAEFKLSKEMPDDEFFCDQHFTIIFQDDADATLFSLAFDGSLTKIA